MDQQERQFITCSLGSGPLEEDIPLPVNQWEGSGVTGAKVLDALETSLSPSATQGALKQNFKLATHEDKEIIREWAQQVRTLGQRAYGSIASSDREANQCGQLVDELTDSDNHE